MVRDPNIDNTNNDSFYLSKPLRTNFQININKIKMSSTSNQEDNNFTFLQPFKSERINQNLKTLKTKITSTLRTQPYTLTKPTKLTSSSPPTTTTTKTNNNAILARINSMSSTLKSLFNKSKNGSKIDITNLTSKKKVDLNNSDQENRSDDDYFKRNETVNDYLLKLSTSPSTTTFVENNDNNCLNDRIKKLSKEYDEIIKTNKQQQPIKSYIDDSSIIINSNKDKLPKWTCLICLNKNRDPIDLYCSICGSAKTSSSSSHHSYASSTSSTIDHTFTKPSFQKPAATTIFGKLTTNTTSSSMASTISSAISPPSSEVSTIRKFSKTWLCPHCSYANDNLKIVCVNCRTPKSDLKLDLSPQVKRKSQHDSASTASSNSSVCSSSNSTITITKIGGRGSKIQQINEIDEDELKQPSSKRSKDQLCTSCQHPIELTIKDKYAINDLVTPTKPTLLNFANTNATTITTLPKIIEEKPPSLTSTTTTTTAQPSLTTLFGNSNKWDCKTCLVQNPNDKDKCACCETPRDNGTKQSLAGSTVSSKPSTESSSPSLTALFGNNNKWNCKTCLVQNPNDKEKCVCCETPRDPSTAKSSSTFPTGSGISLNTNNTNSQISFGSNNKTSTGPITFGSTSFSLTKPTENENKGLSTFTIPSSKPPLETAPTLILGGDSSKAIFNFSGSSKLQQQEASPNKPTFGNTADSNTTSQKSTFNFNNNTTPTSGLTFGKPIINSNNSSSNLGFPSLNTNKNETESIKPPQQTGLFSSSIAPPVAAAAPSTFGSFFGGSTSNTSFTTSSTQAQTQNKESTKFGSLFGSTASSSLSTGFNTQNQNKESTASSLFGNSPSKTTTTSSTPVSSIFGNATSSTATTTTTTNNSAPVSSLFGNQTNSMFTFGNNNNNTTAPTNTTSSGIFGGSNQSLSTTSQPASSSSSSSLFASSAAQPVSSSLFSSTASTSAPSIFGSNAPTTQNSNIFGTNTSNTFSFNNNNNTTSSLAPSFGIFNSQPATTSSSSDIFKNSPSSNNLFSLSNKPATTATTTTTPSPFIFGGSTSTPQQSTSSFGVSSSNNTFTGFQSSTAAPQQNFFNNPTDTTIKPAPTPFAFGAATSTPSPFLFGQSNDQSNPHKRSNDQQNQQPAKIQHTQPSSNTGFNFNTSQTPSFNFSAQPSINFTSSTPNINNNSASAVGGAPFVFNSDPSSGQQTPQRLYKKPVRKLTKK